MISLLTPNEKQRLIAAERERRRIVRLQQVRMQAHEEASRIRDRVHQMKTAKVRQLRLSVASKVPPIVFPLVCRFAHQSQPYVRPWSRHRPYPSAAARPHAHGVHLWLFIHRRKQKRNPCERLRLAHFKKFLEMGEAGCDAMSADLCPAFFIAQIMGRQERLEKDKLVDQCMVEIHSQTMKNTPPNMTTLDRFGNRDYRSIEECENSVDSKTRFSKGNRQ